MKAYRITDYIVPSLILKQEVIARDIYEDTAKFTIPDVVHEFWIGIRHKVDGTVACYRVHNMGAVLWQIHGRVLPQYRKCSLECTRIALKYCINNITNLQKVMCYVPVVHTNVSDHVSEVGFILEGVLTKSYLKDGEVIDQHIYGITKQQIEVL